MSMSTEKKAKEKKVGQTKKWSTGRVGGLSIALLVVWACSKNVSSRPNFIFKAAPSQEAAAKIKDKVVNQGDLFRGIEGELYEAEEKLFEIKMNKLRAFVLEQFMESEPNKKGLSNDEFLDKHIVKGKVQINDKEVEAFIQDRKIPKEHVNDQLKERVRGFLESEKKREAVEAWLAAQMEKNPVEVYFPKPKRPVFDVSVGNSPSVGASDAKVTIVEFSDFQCPYCSKAAEVVHEIKKKYGNKIRVAFKNFPLPFHQHAKGAAEAGLCANEQGNDYFWQMHDKMFADQTKLQPEGLIETAKSIKLDVEKFKKCLNENKFRNQVEAEMQEGEKVAIKSTPTFFVNGQLINGALPIEVFSEIIDDELNK